MTLSDNSIMSSDEQEIPVAAVAAENEAEKAPPVPVRVVKVMETSWKCDYGGKTYHFSPDDESCPICFKSFHSGYNMRRHIIAVHGHEASTVSCDNCDATFATTAALTHHQFIAHVNKKGVSSEAGEEKTCVSDDTRECSQCSKIIKKSNYFRHMGEVHNKTKYDTELIDVPSRPYNCEHCNYNTKRKHDLKRHVMKKHSDVQLSFPCQLCDKTFGYESNMVRHMKTHGDTLDQ